MMLNIGSELASQGKLREARAMFENTLRTASQLGNKEIQGIVAKNIAMLDQLRGDLDSAQLNFQQGRACWRLCKTKINSRFLSTGVGEGAT
jgi:Tetratricopeptide repeat